MPARKTGYLKDVSWTRWAIVLSICLPKLLAEKGKQSISVRTGGVVSGCRFTGPVICNEHAALNEWLMGLSIVISWNIDNVSSNKNHLPLCSLLSFLLLRRRALSFSFVMRYVAIPKLQTQSLDIVVSKLKAGPLRKDPRDRIGEHSLTSDACSFGAIPHQSINKVCSRSLRGSWTPSSCRS